MQVAIGQALRAELSRRGADRDQFGVSGRVAIGDGAVAGRGDDVAIAHDHAADRHLAEGLRLARLVQRQIHE